MANDITQLPPRDMMMDGLERLARDTSIPTDRITELYRLAERREQTLLRRVFNSDMNALQAEIMQIQRDKPNPAFSSRYATEEQIDKAARPIYTKYGFSIRFGTEKPDVPGNVRVVCYLAHRDGYWEEHALEAPPVTGNRSVTGQQGVGGAVTYLKRTLIRMVLNLVTADNPEDDDGNGNGSNRYERWLEQFGAAALDVEDSEQATELLNRESALKMITEMPTEGGLRRRYLAEREKLIKTWLTKIDSAPENKPAGNPGEGSGEPIEGL